MPAPRMVSTTGAALTADEMAFAWRVFVSFSADMKRGWIKVIRRQDPETGTIVEYHADKDIAYVTPGGATDYVAMALPNPVPYRGANGFFSSSVYAHETYDGTFSGFFLSAPVRWGMVTSDAVEIAETPYIGYVPPTLVSSFIYSTVWSGGGNLWIYNYPTNTGLCSFSHLLTFEVPEDCVYPVPAATPPLYRGVDGLGGQWDTYWQAGVAAFNLRRKSWFKKNSDEFIAALKTGFAVGTPGVTRQELQLGRLPEEWEFQIKRDVDKQYDSYAPPNTIGRKTRRDILYSEAAYSETVESDTSANLTQAGVKVTKRVATLQYTFDAVVREVVITGFLTQTVTRHNNSVGAQLGLSRQDVYSNWYNRESTSLPSGVPSAITAPYLRDRSNSRIGAVLNGVVQTGYNTDSKLDVPGNPPTYALYTPPYPAASSTVTATVPAWIEEWHKDSKIVYAKDGAGASTTQNDSALYGVKKIELMPVGLIANGTGVAAAGESVGIFSTEEDGTQVEIYGTAVYNFNWQTGSLTFSVWKPLHGGNGLEVSSKIVDLPQGVMWSDNPVNCLVTYRGLHWPDVVYAIRTRDGSLPTSTVDFDRVLYTLINAVKAG